MQKDLFGSVATVSSLSTFEAPKVDFLQKYSLTLRLEHALVGTLLLIVAYIFVFSFGVESGKRYAMAELKSERAMRERMTRELGEKIFANNQVQTESATVAATTAAAPKAPAVETTVPAETALIDQITASVDEVKTGLNRTGSGQSKTGDAGKTAAKIAQGKGTFAVQTVTFLSKSIAEKQLEKLAQKGYTGVIVPRGKFMEVCVAGFESRSKASQAMEQLKAEGLAPKDAYIRTLA